MAAGKENKRPNPQPVKHKINLCQAYLGRDLGLHLNLLPQYPNRKKRAGLYGVGEGQLFPQKSPEDEKATMRNWATYLPILEPSLWSLGTWHAPGI